MTKPLHAPSPLTSVLGNLFDTGQHRAWWHRAYTAALQSTTGPGFKDKSQGHGVMFVNLGASFYLRKCCECAHFTLHVVKGLRDKIQYLVLKPNNDLDHRRSIEEDRNLDHRRSIEEDRKQ